MECWGEKRQESLVWVRTQNIIMRVYREDTHTHIILCKHTPHSVVVSTLGSQLRGPGFKSCVTRQMGKPLNLYLAPVHIAASSYGT